MAPGIKSAGVKMGAERSCGVPFAPGKLAKLGTLLDVNGKTWLRSGEETRGEAAGATPSDDGAPAKER